MNSDIRNTSLFLNQYQIQPPKDPGVQVIIVIIDEILPCTFASLRSCFVAAPVK